MTELLSEFSALVGSKRRGLVGEELMRIIAGSARGRTIAAPPRGTRPMTGRARESIFSILAHRIVDADVLDLYAGRGAWASRR